MYTRSVLAGYIWSWWWWSSYKVTVWIFKLSSLSLCLSLCSEARRASRPLCLHGKCNEKSANILCINLKRTLSVKVIISTLFPIFYIRQLHIWGCRIPQVNLDARKMATAQKGKSFQQLAKDKLLMYVFCQIVSGNKCLQCQ